MKILKQLKPSREFAAMLMVSLVAGMLFMAYLLLVGIPMTQARNDYNNAYQAYESGDYDRALENVNQSMESWDTQEARDLKQEILLKIEDQNSSE